MPLSDTLHHVIAALETERARIDAAIATLRSLNGAPPAAGNGSAPSARRAMRGASNGSLNGRLLQLLSEGVSGPRDLAAQAKASRYSVNKELKALMRAGRVKTTGSTASRRYHLVGKAPTK